MVGTDDDIARCEKEDLKTTEGGMQVPIRKTRKVEVRAKEWASKNKGAAMCLFLIILAHSPPVTLVVKSCLVFWSKKNCEQYAKYFFENLHATRNITKNCLDQNNQSTIDIIYPSVKGASVINSLSYAQQK